MADRAVQITISGRVQGVGFRAWVDGEAKRLGLAGWARNRRDGRVEALFSGRSEAVDAMLALCRRGPPLASVEDIEAIAASGPVGTGFRITPTV